jgi:energy-coupling factor transporter ATP-binding protein EcfA2
MLTEIHIIDFKSFKELDLKGLGRVNLIVGQNNTGKTSLLEALSVVCEPKQIHGLMHRFRQGSGGPDFFRWLRRGDKKQGWCSLKAVSESGDHRVVISDGKFPPQSGQIHNLLGGPATEVVRLSGRGDLFSSNQTGITPTTKSISVQHRDPQSLVGDFADVTRSNEGERELEDLLRSVDPRIKAMRLDLDRSESSPRPYISADIGLSERVPIAQLGQGVNRLVAIFSELLGQRPDICFIDELENGLHHTVLPRIWRGIAEIAERLNIQVFVTTHSHECLVAAHETFSARKSYDLRVIQLYRVDDRTEGRVLDEKHIAAAIKGDVELR